MAFHPESSSGRAFGGAGSIWQGGHTTGRSLFDHNDDLSWRRWRATDFNCEQHQEERPRSPPSSFLPVPPPDIDPNSPTLYMGDLEPWMDYEYANQVVRLMGWDQLPNPSGGQNGAVTVKIPPPPVDVVPQPNNPGYCFITFPSAAQAANVLASLKSTTLPLLMPNSSRPFNLQWANSSQPGGQPQAPPREYSIFVGDLAPEVSNLDLVAVFRNPALGLRNHREPKFIRPFYSCKSAKIMLDPVTGLSKGYGFVRFTDETEQQRALIEMHGLYCLSRPMRVSPATAKYKPNSSVTIGATFTPPPQPITLTFPAPTPAPHAQDLEEERGGGGSNDNTSTGTVRSNHSPVASSAVAAPFVSTSTPNSTSSNASSTPTPAPTNGKRNANAASPPPLRSVRTPASDNATQGELQNMPHVLHIAQLVSAASAEWNPAQDNAGVNANIQPSGSTGGSLGSYPSSSSITSQPPPYPGQAAIIGANSSALSGGAGGQNVAMGGEAGTAVSDEAWTHQAQARAILGNSIGPNGEQLTNHDPYNTTVFVGGLSPLISEETLKTFFAPFGDIHYVKVPLGKHCGFVQFVRKADAERAIERMHGFPIGGSRVRLSWGRSQYKAAQAAAQAAQAAQAEQAARVVVTAVAEAAANPQKPPSLHLTPEQALLLLQNLGYNTTTSAENAPSAGNAMPFGLGQTASFANGNGPPASFGNSNRPPASFHNGSPASFPIANGPLATFPTPASFPNGNGPPVNPFKGFPNTDSNNVFGFPLSDPLQRSDFSPFASASNTHISFNGQEQQHHHPLTTPSPSQLLPHPSRSYAPGFGPGPSVSGKYSDTNSPHSSSTDSSSGSSSVRFSGMGSSGFPSSAFLENPSAAFQVSDVLRHDSQALLPRLSASTSQPQLSSQSQSQLVASPGHQHQSQGQGDSPGSFMHDVNGTLASLDLGDTYACGAMRSEMQTKDGYRTIPTSISAPLRNLTSPMPKSGSSPEST